MSRSGWFEEEALVTRVLAYDQDDEDDNGDWTEDDEDDWDEDDWDEDDDLDEDEDEEEDEGWDEWSDDDDDDDMFGRKRPHHSDWN